MAGSGRGMIARGEDQFAATQGLKRDLYGALGKACRIAKSSYTRGNRSPFLPRGLSVKIQIDQISRWSLIVPDQIAHQDIENVIVNGNGLFEARHEESEM
jgi:hypothetical protein